MIVVKCWEPSGYERLCQVSSWKQESFPGPLDFREGQETRKGKLVRKITATQKPALASGNPFFRSSRKHRKQQTRRGSGLQAASFPMGMRCGEGQMVGPAARVRSGAAYFKNKACAVYLQIKVGS